MIGAIIQARTGSSRLPKKTLKKIIGKTALEWVILRTQKAAGLERIIAAIPDKKEDDQLARIAGRLKVQLFRGSEDDVLSRFYLAAKMFGLSDIVRITADCPLIDPAIISKMIDFYLKHKNQCDYLSNVHPPSLPDGLDVEIFSFASLAKTVEQAKLPSEREHVTSYIIKNPALFKIANLSFAKEFGNDYSFLRLTLDEPADLILIRRVYQKLAPKNPFFGLKEILELYQQEPSLFQINRSFQRNAGYLKSLADDKKYV